MVLQQTDINYLKTRARLPLRHNGLGMLALQERCEPAFFTTIMAIKKAEHPYENNTWMMLNSNQTWKLVFDDIKVKITEIIDPPAPLTDTNLAKIHLHEIMDKEYTSTYRKHMTSSVGHQLQVLEANKAMGSRAILAAWPKRKETTLDDYEFIHAIRTRIGYGLEQFLKINQTQQDTQCKACSKPNAKAVPEHLSCCPKIASKRHNDVVAMIRQMIQAAGVENVLMEYDVGLGDNKKIDIWFRDPDPDNHLQPYFMVDPTIIQSFPANNVNIPKTTTNLINANNKKFNTYGQAALQNSATLVPLAFTTFGAYHGHFQKFLSRVAKIAVATQAIDPCKEKHFVSYWKTNILFSIARSTAKYAMLAAHYHLSA